jgi:hypothetical protein
MSWDEPHPNTARGSTWIPAARGAVRPISSTPLAGAGSVAVVAAAALGWLPAAGHAAVTLTATAALATGAACIVDAAARLPGIPREDRILHGHGLDGRFRQQGLRGSPRRG